MLRRNSFRILMISGIFYPKVDGSVIAVDNLIKCLQRYGHSVKLITRKLSNSKTTEKQGEIQVIAVGPRHSSFLNRFLLGLNQFRAGTRIIKEDEIDIIHAHGFSSLIAGVALGKLFNKPLVVSFHGFTRLHFRKARSTRGSDLMFAVLYPFERFLIGRADAILAQSSALKNVICEMYRVSPENVQVVPHAIDENLFKYSPPSESMEPVVLFVGSLSNVHGSDLLIEAAPRVLEDVVKAKFLIVGQGPLEPYLRDLIKSKGLGKSVLLPGPVADRQKLATLYATAKVVVIPLRYKGYILSLVALEAMSTGRPVITTMTLNADLQQHSVFTVDSDANNLSMVIRKILNADPKTYAQLCWKARKFIEEQNSMKVVAESLENVYMHSKHKNKLSKSD